MSETQPITAQRLLDHAASDHVRGCMGRQYSCTCEYDTITERLLVDAAARIQELEPKAAAYDACSSKIDCLSRGAVPVRDDGAERIRRMERALTWIVNSPSAHPANMVKVAEEALQPKDTAK